MDSVHPCKSCFGCGRGKRWKGHGGLQEIWGDSWTWRRGKASCEKSPGSWKSRYKCEAGPWVGVGQSGECGVEGMCEDRGRRGCRGRRIVDGG